MSVIGQGEVLWNFYYNGNVAMDSCYEVYHTDFSVVIKNLALVYSGN